MSTWNKSTLANNLLEYIGVKPAGQSVSGEHSNYVQSFIDSAYDGFYDAGLAPYDLDAIPEWAHIPWLQYLAVDVGPRYGKPYPLTFKDTAIRQMSRSVFGGPKSHLPIKSKDF